MSNYFMKGDPVYLVFSIYVISPSDILAICVPMNHVDLHFPAHLQTG